MPNLVSKQSAGSYGTCSHCNAPIKIVDSKFCEACGRPTSVSFLAASESSETYKLCMY
ncbi:MAG: hypothetical protein ACTSRL_19505 [Candidatus Helarchaeota archaeon]